jgi:hypothetical protein
MSIEATLKDLLADAQFYGLQKLIAILKPLTE